METMKMTNLKFLEEATNGEKTMKKEIIEMFMEQLPTLRSGFGKYLQNKQWNELGNTVRIAKSSAMIFGLNELSTHLRQLQIKILNRIGYETYSSYIDEFETITALAEIELTEELYRLSSND